MSQTSASWKVTALSASGKEVTVDAEALIVEIDGTCRFKIHVASGGAIAVSTDSRPEPNPQYWNAISIRPAAGNCVILSSVRIDSAQCRPLEG